MSSFMHLCILCFFIIFLLEIAGSLHQQELFIHIIFLISEDFATTEYFTNHTKKCGLLKSICMFKVSNIYYTYVLRTHSINQAFSYCGEVWVVPPPPPHPPLAANCLLPTRKFPLVDSSHQSCIHPRIFNNNFYVIT